MKCSNLNCNAMDCKLKACCGCFKMVYCCRNCQKVDWKKQHKYKCSKSWTSLYSTVRSLPHDFEVRAYPTETFAELS
eukprot:UN08861